MTGRERREQLVGIGRTLFAERGFEATTVEEIAARAGVSTHALTRHGSPRVVAERGALALLDYIENSSDGFRILVRDSPMGQSTGSFASLISDVASQVEHLLAAEFRRRGFDPDTAPMYAQMLVGMVALCGQWWLDSPRRDKREVAAHVVNLAWNGLAALDPAPRLRDGRLGER